MKRKHVYFIGAIVALVLAVCIGICQQKKAPLWDWRPTRMQQREKLLLDFVEEQMITSGGVHTTYHQAPYEAAWASGEEVLSESQGLMMCYYAAREQKEKFEEIWQYVKDYLIKENMITYREGFMVNACIDDLRIMQALLVAAEVFAQPTYREEALCYSNYFYDYNVKDGYLVDFYDLDYEMANHFITLTQVDLQTLAFLGKENRKYKQLYKKMSRVVAEGYIGDDFPLYYPRYNYLTKQYEGSELHTTEGLITLYHLATVGQIKEESLSWVKARVVAGDLYGSYNLQGVAANEIESTAAYAVAALIGATVGDVTLYEKSIEQMERYQVLAADSVLYGAFGEEAGVYSFDQLMALIAYSRSIK